LTVDCYEYYTYDLLTWIHGSNLAGEFGQQVLRPWGDRNWVRRILESVISMSTKNEPIVREWMMGYNKRIQFIRVHLTYPCGLERMTLANKMKDADIGQFGEIFAFISEYWPAAVVVSHGVSELNLNYVEKAVLRICLGVENWDRKNTIVNQGVSYFVRCQW
jgi:hypothetical protein